MRTSGPILASALRGARGSAGTLGYSSLLTRGTVIATVPRRMRQPGFRAVKPAIGGRSAQLRHRTDGRTELPDQPGALAALAEALTLACPGDVTCLHRQGAGGRWRPARPVPIADRRGAARAGGQCAGEIFGPCSGRPSSRRCPLRPTRDDTNICLMQPPLPQAFSRKPREAAAGRDGQRPEVEDLSEAPLQRTQLGATPSRQGECG